MLPWFLRDPVRLEEERRGIESLAASAEWFVAYEWRVVDGLSIDTTIRVHDYDYELRVSLPPLFPDAPAVVRPINTNQRLSYHQYGAEGPLCLEWGPDNWHPEITAAKMLESAYRLLHTENPLGQGRPEFPVVAPSRHQLTIGQEVRDGWLRWYLSSGLRRVCQEQTRHSEGRITFSLRDLGENWCALIHEVSQSGGETWMDPQIPDILPGATPVSRNSGVWVKTDLDARVIRNVKNFNELRAILIGSAASAMPAGEGRSSIERLGIGLTAVLICDHDDEPHLFVVASGETVIYCAAVESEPDRSQRRPSASLALDEKKIGIVGLGAAGSKIAVCLTRMGVRRFFFVDHDLLLPENLQRHALNWQGVTQHKVDALVRALLIIEPSVEADVSRLHLSGQESNAGVNTVLARLAECDLIIDATADPRAFNLLAAVCRAAGKPLVWLEIFGGGIGGLVARSRPGADPAPQDMRAVYASYCEANPAPDSLVSTVDYSQESPTGEVLTASDADVGIIAYHAARFVPDCFVSADHSVFPHPMYLIGLAKEWVFEAPFATIPISVAALPIAPIRDTVAEHMSEETISFLAEVFAKAAQI